MEADSMTTVKQVHRVQPMASGTQITRTEYVRTEYPEGNSTTTTRIYTYTIYTPQAQVETGPHRPQVDQLT